MPSRRAIVPAASAALFVVLWGASTGCDLFGPCANGSCQEDVICDDGGCRDLRDGGVTTGLVASTTFAAVPQCTGGEAMRIPKGRWSAMAATGTLVFLGNFSSPAATFLKVQSSDGKITNGTAAFGFAAGATSQAQGFRSFGNKIWWHDKAAGRVVQLDGDSLQAQALTGAAGVSGFDLDPGSNGRYGYQTELVGSSYRLVRVDVSNRTTTVVFTESRANTRGTLLAVAGSFAIVNVESPTAPGLVPINISTGIPGVPIVTTTNNRAYGDQGTLVWSTGTSGTAAATFKYGPASTPGASTAERSFNPEVKYAAYAPGPLLLYAFSEAATRDWAYRVDLKNGTVAAVSSPCNAPNQPKGTLDAIAIDANFVYVASENSSDSSALWRFRR